MSIGAASVSTRALLQRINRALAKRDEVVKTTRGDRLRFDLGEYYCVDYDRNLIVEDHIDLEDLGRELGVLKGWERLEGRPEGDEGIGDP